MTREFIILLIVLASNYCWCICPSAEIVYPCTCVEELKLILCENITDEKFTVKGEFDRINQALGHANVFFNSFFLSNTPVREIEENVFGNVTFGDIVINQNRKLTHVHPAAFRLSSITQSFAAIENNISNSGEFFTALKNLPSLEEIDASRNSLTMVPDYAFKPLAGHISKLTTISLRGNKIRTIGNFPFSELPQLRNLDLSSNEINFLSNSAFTINVKRRRGPAEKSLLIYLYNNQLNDSSIEENAFANINTESIRTNLDMGNNRLTGVGKKLFEKFLKNRPSILYLWNNKIKCDCDVKWLIDCGIVKRKQIVALTCLNGKKIEELPKEHFRRCKGKGKGKGDKHQPA